jgi:predicted regulator of Ras-like GTPase activity (Roadblock/LC7/MglB family)
MDAILQGLMELAGVRATMVLDGTGQVVAHRGHSVYDRGVCEQVGTTVTKAIESIQLQQEDWETITAQFADGRILVRRVATRPDAPRLVLAVVADATLNASFATVALRVAANKVKGMIEGASSQPPGASGSQPLGAAPGASSSILTPADSRPVLANTGLSWSSKSSNLGSHAGGSGGGLSGVAVADPASSAFLARCAKELARHVGPIAKVYVQEAARRVSPEGPFSMSVARQLVDDLAGQIEDPKDRAQFRKGALEKK